eukprot:TRINITY_DN19160_c0_g1_i1.p1 TRINITY_DN19160_c0_g1~~TRINITY_DN19160_c0_g1_i1.p1  ORF type:complete len:311 (+),score=47.00 TRINITY_DN19160_c0_g1_i1:126-1058(+)
MDGQPMYVPVPNGAMQSAMMPSGYNHDAQQQMPIEPQSHFMDVWQQACHEDVREQMTGNFAQQGHSNSASSNSNSDSSRGSARQRTDLEAVWLSAASCKGSQYGSLPSMPPPGLGDPQRPSLMPSLLWCEGNAQNRIDETQALAERYDRNEFRYFRSPVNFTRWLFEAGVSTAEPRAVVVLGWRELKPCCLAINAAITGNFSGLRFDAKRPQLRRLTGPQDDGGSLRSAIRAIVILSESDNQAERVNEYIQSQECLSCKCEVHLALGFRHLLPILDKLLIVSAPETGRSSPMGQLEGLLPTTWKATRISL